MQRLAAILAIAVWATPAFAHDSWIEASAYQVQAGETVPLTLMVGTMGDQASVSLASRPAWLRVFTSQGPTGVIDLLEQSADKPAAAATFAAPGTHLIALHTGNFSHAMGAEEFAAYLEQEGLTTVRTAWEASGRTAGPVKEVYARAAKALVHVGPGAPDTKAYVTSPVGLDLEIVPLRSPYDLKPGESFPVRVLYDDKPLAGALVSLGSLDRPKEPRTRQRTDAKGEVAFPRPASGNWLVNVVWSVPAAGRFDADYKTTFSSLSFGLAPTN